MNLPELGRFLRTRRARITPAEVGLITGSRRRVPGLRREEVAQLAGTSVDYYIELERGRGARPSAQVLAALARALSLEIMRTLNAICERIIGTLRSRSLDRILALDEYLIPTTGTGPDQSR